MSRWEAEGGYPDLELLPALADFFAVSTDELLGYKLSEREQELASIKKEIERLDEVGSVEECLAFARNAFARYPNDSEIRLNLGIYLHNTWDKTHDEGLLDEVESLYQSVVNECDDEDTRDNAIGSLIILYKDTHQSEKAKALLGRLTPLKYCREETMAMGIGDGNTEFYIQDLINKLTDELGSAIRDLALHEDLPNDPSTWDYKIEMLRISNQLYHLIYGEDLLYHHGRLSFNHWLISTYQMSLERTEDALDSLEKMCEHAVACDLSYQNDHGKHFTSFLVDTIIYPEKSKDFHELTEHTDSYYMLDRLQESRYDPIRKDPRFIAVTETLCQYAR